MTSDAFEGRRESFRYPAEVQRFAVSSKPSLCFGLSFQSSRTSQARRVLDQHDVIAIESQTQVLSLSLSLSLSLFLPLCGRRPQRNPCALFTVFRFNLPAYQNSLMRPRLGQADVHKAEIVTGQASPVGSSQFCAR